MLHCHFKKYVKEIILLLLQLSVFYLFPLFMNVGNPMGMVLLLLTATFVLSLVTGSISERKIKYLYPIITAGIFVPSVFIYYNESALIHSLWYLTDSSLGIALETIMEKSKK